MKINIPESTQERVVIIGGGFAGLAAARQLAKANYQVVLLDKNNFHQFQPLFYQVAMAGLEPSSIAFPFRKLFRRRNNVFIRVTEVLSIDPEKNQVITSLGHCNFDHLLIGIGADTNYYGNEEVERNTLSMKSVSEALYLRNSILSDYEKALTTIDYDERQGYIDIVIVGGGPTGVELAGALAEMKKYIMPKDYPELNCDEIDIYLIQSAPQLLKGMSEESSEKSLAYLKDLGVEVRLNTRVNNYDGEYAYLSDGEKIRSNKVIWAAGIQGNSIPGLPESALTYGRRLEVDRFSKVKDTTNIYAIGDIAYMEEEAFPQGHPQVAQVAIQQGINLAQNLKRQLKGQKWKPFVYNDKGSMATVGRNRAVVDLPKLSFQGFPAWTVWLLVHLFAILGTKNKLFVFLNWVWNYLTYDQGLRLIIRAKAKDK
ncbi:NAD(P)/FAD-dependent oxidoreductase [Lewinella cohaerens]|uniref:NAD(P)/FAD-dependent oxidoreductase n=1 Tax=Lewinella cohaerens TaxID=70995 RepID=UPI00035F423F|nr:NAD(P)/FAD-dependent oxidoreductase [Lewinella cohaerens]